MITEDRKQLNDRFIHVFQILEDRGVVVKNDRKGKGMGDFAEKLLGNRQYGHIIRAYLNEEDRRVISYSQARTLCREYGINESYMLDGLGSPFGMDIPASHSDSSSDVSNNILFTTTEAFAGAAMDQGSFFKESNSFFSLPGLNTSNKYVAFPINGNSMDPIIHNGDIVVCRPIERIEDIEDNGIYAIKNNGAVWVKYVQKIYLQGRLDKLKLISANHLEHDPFVEDVNMHTKLYKVIRKISDI